MEKVKIAKDIFGKSGEGMVSLALQGTAGLKAMGLEASALGVALSGIDNAKLAEADDAMMKIGAAIGGIANQIGVVLAPYITAVSDQFIEWMKNGTTTGSVIAQAVDWITTAVGYAFDAVQLFLTAFYALRAGVTEVFSYILAGIDKIIQGFGYLYEKITGTTIALTTFAKDMADALHESAQADLGKALAMSAKPWAHEAVRTLKNEIETGAQKRAEFGAAKQGLGGQAGQSIKPALVKTGFAGAQQAGSSAAYSSILQARARITDSRQDIIAKNSTTTAVNTGKMAVHLAMLAGAKNQRVDGAQFREQVSGR